MEIKDLKQRKIYIVSEITYNEDNDIITHKELEAYYSIEDAKGHILKLKNNAERYKIDFWKTFHIYDKAKELDEIFTDTMTAIEYQKYDELQRLAFPGDTIIGYEIKEHEIY